MESEGGSKRPQDQLQGFAVQDQAVRPFPAGSRVNSASQGPAPAVLAPSTYKVVIRFEDHAVRGFALASELGTIEQLMRNAPQHPLDTIRLTLADGGEVREIATAGAKAIFFVMTFDGDLRHRALHFHEHAPVMQGLWVRVRFHDGEAVEGIIPNTHDHVLGEGFFMTPPTRTATTS